MFSAFFKAIAQLSDPAVRRYVWTGIGGAIVVMVVLVVAMWHAIHSETLLDQWWLAWLDWIPGVDLKEWLAGAVGSFVILTGTWFLFPLVVSCIIAFFLEGVAAAVEARHYPHLDKAPGIPMIETVLTTVKFLSVMILLNVLVLPLYLIPLINLFIYYGLNGYLLGREYFELVALRRLAPPDAWLLRKTNGFRVFVAGAFLAFLLTIPVVNLLAPVVGTAAMVHLFQAWRKDGKKALV